MKHEESNIQQAFIQWCDLNTGKYPELKYMHHSPNGGRRNAREAARLKKEGVKKGFPDLTLAVARHGFHGLYIEVKTEKGKLTESQKDWQRFLKEQYYYHFVCRSVDECIEVVKSYLG